MSAFKPTDEQLFDYFIREADPEMARKIKAYLEGHPLEASKLGEYAEIQTSFQNLPLTSPSEVVLARVREQARVHLKKSLWQQIGDYVFARQNLSYALMICLVAALSIVVAQLRSEGPIQIAANTRSAKNKLSDEERLATQIKDDTIKAGGSALDLAITGDDTVTVLDNQYALGKEQFTKGLYQDAVQSFQKIIAADPLFAKRIELYTYWIQSLDKLGQTEKAKTVRAALEKVLKEEPVK